jgi:hypothetical protein
MVPLLIIGAIGATWSLVVVVLLTLPTARSSLSFLRWARNSLRGVARVAEGDCMNSLIVLLVQVARVTRDCDRSERVFFPSGAASVKSIATVSS